LISVMDDGKPKIMIGDPVFSLRSLTRISFCLLALASVDIPMASAARPYAVSRSVSRYRSPYYASANQQYRSRSSYRYSTGYPTGYSRNDAVSHSTYYGYGARRYNYRYRPTRLQPDIVTTGQITIDLTATRLSPAFPITVTITSIPAGFVTHGTRTLPVTVRLIQDIAVPMSPMEGVTVSLRAVMLLTGAAMSLTGAPTMVRPGRTLPAIMEIFTGPTALASGLIALPCMAALSFKLAITWATVAAVTIASGKRIPQSEQPDRVL